MIRKHNNFVTELTLPCWIIGTEGDEEITFVIIEANDDRCIPVFTNLKLAENFLSEWGINAQILAFDSQSRLVKFLKKITARYVLHNPSNPRATFRTSSIRAILKNLRAEL